MSTFIALYHGNTMAEAKLVAVSTAPTIVTEFAARLLREPPDSTQYADPVIRSIERGRRLALHRIARAAIAATQQGTEVCR